MGTRTQGDGAQEPKLARQCSLYNLTLDEVQTQLGNLGKPLSSMNLEELLKSVGMAEANLATLTGIDCAVTAHPGRQGSAATLCPQPSLKLSRALSLRTVDEVWTEIQQGVQSSNQEKKTQERQTTLGEMTLEDFLVKAGVVAESMQAGQQNSGPVLRAEPILATQQNMPQQAQWMQYQLPSMHYPQQQNLMTVFMPGTLLQQPIPVAANPIIDAACPETQITMSPSPLMSTLSDTQTPGRKRVAPGGVMEKTVERRQKRMIKNRESAARSRARKQAYTHELESKISLLEEENERLKKQKVVEELPCSPPPEPKCQLRRTSSSLF